MSTRCQVIVKDGDSELWFYRHSDGYPECVIPSLEKFLGWVKAGKVRDNVEQACGWPVILGRDEYAEYHGRDYEPTKDWKVGAYEPSVPERHGDIEYLYTVDLAAKTVSVEDA